jgi:D-amino-acid dehydrogenase
MSKHVVIIGAGVVGMASSHHCLGAGLRVTLVDPGEPGQPQAASYGNAGWLSPHSILPPAYPGVWKQVPRWLLDPLGPLTVRWRYLPKALPWLKDYIAGARTIEQLKQTSLALRAMLKEAPLLHKEMAQTIGASELIRVREVLHAYRSEADYQSDTYAWDIRKEAGVTWRAMEATELHALEPALAPDYQYGVLVNETGYCVNPSAYVAALFSHSTQCGAQFLQTQAESINFRDSDVVSVTTASGEVACDAVVIAVGARAKPLALQAGDRVPLATERGYHYVVQTDDNGPNHPTMFMDKKVIVTPMNTGIRIAGQVEIAELDDVPNWRRAEILKQLLAQLYPGLAPQISVEHITVWMGRRPSLPDGLPCIGPSSRSPSVVHAYGHGHVGLAGSARTGRLVAQMLAGVKPEIDLTPFRPQRFAKVQA